MASPLPAVHPIGMQVPGVWVSRMKDAGKKDEDTRDGG